MRVLIVAAVLACAAAAPSGLLASPYAHGIAGSLGFAHGAPLAVAHAAPLAVAHAVGPALPTISPGDIQGAAIDAHVEANDHVRASADAAREYHDQAAELQGQAINAAEDHSWQAVDAVKTAEAQLDGAAAGVAPVLAKQLAGHAAVVAAPAVSAYGAHGVAAYGAHGVAAYGAPVLGHGVAAYGAPGVAAYGAPALGHGISAYAAPAHASSQTVVTQSLSQSHPAPVVHASLVHGSPLAYSAGHHAW